MDLDDIADELYGLTPDEFTDTRNNRAKEVRASGDRQLAEAVRGLPKPSAAAWAANLVVRTRHPLVDELVELGQGLRRAHEERVGSDIRRLSAQRQELVGRLLRAAREEAEAAGHPLGPEPLRQLAGTLEAALADESAAGALRAGRLSEALTHVGFGELTSLEGGGERARRRRTEPRSAQADPVPKRRSQPRNGAPGPARSELALARARGALESAEAAVGEARRRQQAASAARRQAGKMLKDSERELAAADAALQRAQQSRERAKKSLVDAQNDRRRRG